MASSASRISFSAEEDQHIAVRLAGELVEGGVHSLHRVEVGLRFGVLLLVDRGLGHERAIPHLHGEGSAADLHDRGAEARGIGEVTGEALRIDGRRGDDDVEIGTVQYARGSKGRTTAAVTDPLRLLQWARIHAPHLITEHVNVPGQTVLLAAAKTGGWLDRDTGELLDIDGITVTEGGNGTATLRVVPNDDAPAVVQRAVAAGLLTQIRELT